MPITKMIVLQKSGITVEYTIGKNAQENFDIIDNAEQYHWWFHIEGQSSGHVISNNNEFIDKKTIRDIVKQGAVLCKQYSKYASMKNVRIVYARICDVEKTDKIGMVSVSNSKVIVI
jgi:hypothetical protein